MPMDSDWVLTHASDINEKGMITGYGTVDGEVYAFLLSPDTDKDGMADWWEEMYFTDLVQEGTGDWDGDGLLNLDEHERSTNPDNVDTDGDGMWDAWEVDNDLDPRTDDAHVDADGDGYTNFQEWEAGTDPRDPESYPTVQPVPMMPFYGFFILMIALGLMGIRRMKRR
jgi:hypothetical protein